MALGSRLQVNPVSHLKHTDGRRLGSDRSKAGTPRGNWEDLRTGVLVLPSGGEWSWSRGFDPTRKAAPNKESNAQLAMTLHHHLWDVSIDWRKREAVPYVKVKPHTEKLVGVNALVAELDNIPTTSQVTIEDHNKAMRVQVKKHKNSAGAEAYMNMFESHPDMPLTTLWAKT